MTLRFQVPEIRTCGSSDRVVVYPHYSKQRGKRLPLVLEHLEVDVVGLDLTAPIDTRQVVE